MLKQVFQSVPIRYHTRSTYEGGWLFGIDYHANIDPYVEKLAWVQAIIPHNMPTLISEHRIFVQATMWASYWPSWAVSFHMFDSRSGAYLGRLTGPSNLGSITMGAAFRSRLGAIWTLGWGSFEFNEVILGETSYTFGTSTIEASRFGKAGFSSTVGLDENRDIFLHGSYSNIEIFKYSTGELLHTIFVGAEIAALALEEADHVYILQNDGQLILMDYTKGTVLGAAKVPPRISGDGYWNSVNTCVMTWDWLYKRLLVSDQVPDNANGSCATRIRGYRNVPIPTRITAPIPLKVPRRGRKIPVMTQVVGDMNEGVGGYLVSSVISGPGRVVGTPITDNVGRAITQVYCTNTGAAKITCSAKLGSYDTPTVLSTTDYSEPDYDDGTLPPGPDNPVDPGATAPNGMATMEAVYASQTWRLAEIYEDEPDGRGAFTGAVVTALHAIDANWGHVRKNPGQNQYDGHAVDAINWKRPDGTTAEIYDIVSGDGQLVWGFVDGTPANLAVWYY